MDYHPNSVHPVAARLFWRKDKPEISAHRQLDSRSDRDRRHTRHIETPWDRVNIPRRNNWIKSVKTDDGSLLLNRKAICHPEPSLGGIY